MAMIAPNHGLTGKQLAALNLLTASPNGCTEAAMKANGFGIFPDNPDHDNLSRLAGGRD